MVGAYHLSAFQRHFSCNSKLIRPNTDRDQRERGSEHPRPPTRGGKRDEPHTHSGHPGVLVRSGRNGEWSSGLQIPKNLCEQAWAFIGVVVAERFIYCRCSSYFADADDDDDDGDDDDDDDDEDEDADDDDDDDEDEYADDDDDIDDECNGDGVMVMQVAYPSLELPSLGGKLQCYEGKRADETEQMVMMIMMIKKKSRWRPR